MPVTRVPMPQHVQEGYTVILQLDNQRRRKFRAVGLSRFLFNYFWRRYRPQYTRRRCVSLAMSVYQWLRDHQYIVPLGYIKGRHLSGGVKEFMVYRRRYKSDRRDYRPQRTHRKPEHRRTGRRLPARIGQRGRMAVGAVIPIRPRRNRPVPPYGVHIIFTYSRRQEQEARRQLALLATPLKQ